MLISFGMDIASGDLRVMLISFGIVLARLYFENDFHSRFLMCTMRTRKEILYKRIGIIGKFTE